LLCQHVGKGLEAAQRRPALLHAQNVHLLAQVSEHGHALGDTQLREAFAGKAALAAAAAVTGNAQLRPLFLNPRNLLAPRRLKTCSQPHE